MKHSAGQFYADPLRQFYAILPADSLEKKFPRNFFDFAKKKTNERINERRNERTDERTDRALAPRG